MDRHRRSQSHRLNYYLFNIWTHTYELFMHGSTPQGKKMLPGHGRLPEAIWRFETGHLWRCGPPGQAELRAQSRPCSWKWIARLVCQRGLSARRRRRRTCTTDSQHSLPRAPNRLMVGKQVSQERGLSTSQAVVDTLPPAQRYTSDGYAANAELVCPEGAEHVVEIFFRRWRESRTLGPAMGKSETGATSAAIDLPDALPTA